MGTDSSYLPVLKHTGPISVIIPCFRSANTIERAIESVRNQTLMPAEVILIDDASDDNSFDFLNIISNRYEYGWIKVIKLTVNSGPGLARNAGWDASSNKFIAFLDADDSWHPNKIKLQYEWMLHHPEVAMTGHGTLHIGETDPLPIIESMPKPRVASLYGMLWSNKMITRSVMLLSDVPYRFEGKAVTEDYLLWLQIIADGLLVMKFDVPLAFSYRPEFSEGGYSGQLWVHEKRELNALLSLKREARLVFFTFFVASLWSLLKYVRRVMKLKMTVYFKYD